MRLVLEVGPILVDVVDLERTFSRLNEDFYTAAPASYFRGRLYLLALAATKSSELDALLRDGVEYEGITLRIAEDAELSSEESERLEKSFLITESHVLLHHAMEALLRLYLGHRGFAECPWLECASLMDFRKFKEEVSNLARSSWPVSEKDRVANVFLGSSAPPEVPGVSASIAASERLLRLTAKRLLDDGNLYNATKHGMTIRAGDSYFAFGEDISRPAVAGSGTSLMFLERERTDGGVNWRQTTRWVSPVDAMFLTELCICQIEALWTVARTRYVGADFRGVALVTEEAVSLAAKGIGRSHPGITRFSVVVAQETAPSPRGRPRPGRG